MTHSPLAFVLGELIETGAGSLDGVESHDPRAIGGVDAKRAVEEKALERCAAGGAVFRETDDAHHEVGAVVHKGRVQEERAGRSGAGPDAMEALLREGGEVECGELGTGGVSEREFCAQR